MVQGTIVYTVEHRTKFPHGTLTPSHMWRCKDATQYILT